MQVRKLKVFPVEAIVRGYITGSAWKEYQEKGTVHGLQMPEGLKESQEFPQGPIFTPSTKAEQGEHDENIHPDKGTLRSMLGPVVQILKGSINAKLINLPPHQQSLNWLAPSTPPKSQVLLFSFTRWLMHMRLNAD